MKHHCFCSLRNSTSTKSCQADHQCTGHLIYFLSQTQKSSEAHFLKRGMKALLLTMQSVSKNQNDKYRRKIWNFKRIFPGWTSCDCTKVLDWKRWFEKDWLGMQFRAILDRSAPKFNSIPSRSIRAPQWLSMCASAPSPQSHIPNLNMENLYFPISFSNVNNKFSNSQEFCSTPRCNLEMSFFSEETPFTSEEGPHLVWEKSNILISSWNQENLWETEGCSDWRDRPGLLVKWQREIRSLFLSREHFTHFTTHPITTCLTFHLFVRWFQCHIIFINHDEGFWLKSRTRSSSCSLFVSFLHHNLLLISSDCWSQLTWNCC